MENASKALLIAGAILLVIAIIAIGVGIVTKTRGTINEAENQIDTMEVKMHNNQFTVYEGTVTGEEVKECISKVLANNNQTKKSAFFVLVTVGSNTYGKYLNGTTIISGNKTSLSSADIISNDIYTCTTSINSSGIINQISFTKK